jgi:hypothetical protein
MRTITLNIKDAPPLDEPEEVQVQSYLALVTPLFEQLPLPIMAEAVARTVCQSRRRGRLRPAARRSDGARRPARHAGSAARLCPGRSLTRADCALPTGTAAARRHAGDGEGRGIAH